jgi:ATP-dependent Clp protease ATP-binding subunit ClpA
MTETTYLKNISTSEKSTADALKDHYLIPIIMDTLSRKENHHVLLTGTHSEKIKLALLEALALQLTETNTPKMLRNNEVIYVNLKNIPAHLSVKTFEETLLNFLQQNKNIILAINLETNEFNKIIFNLLRESACRILLFKSTENFANLNSITFPELTNTQLVTLIKCYKNELEQFHQGTIPDETCQAALTLASHYLPQFILDKTLDLLDSAAARATATEHYDHSGQFKPVVTTLTLTHVVSSWTQIPVSHLHNNTFQLTKFIENMQRRIFGQDDALTTIATVLQHARIKIQEKSAPLCSFLFVGANETGKTETAKALVEQLFGNKNALLRVNLSEEYKHIKEMTAYIGDGSSVSLLTAIQQTPYAVILLENIELAQNNTLAFFREIFKRGVITDSAGHTYNFQHAILIATTNLGAARIAELTQSTPVYETNRNLDLMQLVLNEQPHHIRPELHPHLSTQEIADELMTNLEEKFSRELLTEFTLVPFLPLDYTALEKIIRIKIRNLAKNLDANFNIELNFAPEVIKFLSHEALWRKPAQKPLEKILENHLYRAVANEILAHAEDKNRPQRLLLQLNESGQLLRCEFIGGIGTPLYNNAL